MRQFLYENTRSKHIHFAVVDFHSIFIKYRAWTTNFFFLFILLVFFLCIRYVDSERRFQHVLEACGVNKSLMKLGVKEGDTVIVGEVCLNYFLISLSLHFESFITFSFFFLGCLLMDHDVNLQICLVMLKRKK